MASLPASSFSFESTGSSNAVRETFSPVDPLGVPQAPGLDPSITFSSSERAGLLSPGGGLDIEALGGTEGVLDIVGGLIGAGASLASGFARANGELARERALHATAQQIAFSRSVAVRESSRIEQEVVGGNRAITGARGITMSGSSLEVLAQTAEDARWNTQVIDYNFKTQEANVLYQARLARWNASIQRNNAIGGAIGQVGSGLASAGLRGLS
jgi:hypothetical protein